MTATEAALSVDEGSDEIKDGEKEKILAFDEEHQKIMAKYGGELPKPKSSLKTILVVPSLAELSNDNFWRLLRSLALQKDVLPGEFETLIIINNSTNTARLAQAGDLQAQGELGGQSSRYEGKTTDILIERYRENQSHLHLLKILREAREKTEKGFTENEVVDSALSSVRQKLELTAYETEIFKLAIRRKVHIYGIDCSSPKKALEIDQGHKSSPGFARNIGGHIAYERLKSLGKENTGWIDFADGDCFLPPNYFSVFSRLAAEETKRPFAVKNLISQTPDIPKNIEKQHEGTYKLAALLNYLGASIISNRYTYTEMTINTQGLEGGQIALRPYRYREVGGYPTFSAVEDYRFAEELFELEKPLYLTETWVYLSDRGREGSIDGAKRGYFSSDQNPEQVIDSMRENLTCDQSPKLRALLAFNKKLEQESEQARYRELREYYFRRESLQRIFFIQSAEKIIPEICQIYTFLENEGDLSTETVIDTLREKVNPRTYDFLQSNKVLIESIMVVIETISKDKTLYDELLNYKKGGDREILYQESDLNKVVFNFFRKYLPEYFEPPPHEEPNYDIELPEVGQERQLQINMRDYIHIIQALYHFEAEKRNSIES